MVHLSDWMPWSQRGDLPDAVGLYVIAKGAESNIVYVGRTWSEGGLRGRIRAFHRSATTGLKGHAGGVTYHARIGPVVDDLMLRVHLPVSINPDAKIMRPYLDYAERHLIWTYVEAHGELPVCNSE